MGSCTTCGGEPGAADGACPRCATPVGGPAAPPAPARRDDGSPAAGPAAPASRAGPAPPAPRAGPVDVFISHAPEDERPLGRLEVHLGLMKRQGLLRTWHRGRVGAGGEPDAEAAARLDAAWLILLLVSADYLASEDCFTHEMTRALARHDSGAARVIPVLVHACDWASAPFGKLEPLPTGSKPVSSWRNRNEGWANIARGIRSIVEAARPSAGGLEAGESLAEPTHLGAPWGYVPRPPSMPEYGPPPTRVEKDLDSRPTVRSLSSPGESDDSYERSLADELLQAPRSPGPAPGAPRTVQRRPLLELRPRTADLVGREDDVAEILQDLGPGGTMLVGPAGIGKTALALRLAEELAPHYPGAALYIDLDGASKTPLDPAMAMVRVLEELIPGFERPFEAAALEAAYRAALGSRRALLVLDNARDRVQVERLVPQSTPSLFLVTAARPFSLPGLPVRGLGALAPDDACALIRALAPRVPEAAAAELAALCGCVPLALCVAAGALAAEENLDPADYVARLRAAPRALGPADAPLGASLDLLPRSLQEAWCQLGTVPGDFDLEVAARVLGETTSAASEHLRELARRNLVTWDDATGLGRMHDSARAHARARRAAAVRAPRGG
ncbi:TIR domain-containing protein [Sorangium sp. So ce513]|uniref:TIR domain-containing protein n=1 Tax=Sorangium sp. So ce513 TaxID=3133315 RepID=UPI003F61AEC6